MDKMILGFVATADMNFRSDYKTCVKVSTADKGLEVGRTWLKRKRRKKFSATWLFPFERFTDNVPLDVVRT